MQKTRMWTGLALTAVLVLGLAILAGCGDKVDQESSAQAAPGPLTMDPATYEQWEIALVEMRINKNEQFAVAETSPLVPATIPDFKGLNYYFPAADLHFRTPFVAAAGTDTVALTKRKGDIVKYIRRGQVSFTHEGKQYTLPVFGPVDTTGGNYLWLPFTDKTSGHETYAGGRYLDITLDSEGMVDLDFNYAYNPLCDYNAERYNCTLPPAESHLDFAVEAGEKSFSTDH